MGEPLLGSTYDRPSVITVSVSWWGSPERATIWPPSSEYHESEATRPRTNTAWTVRRRREGR